MFPFERKIWNESLLQVVGLGLVVLMSVWTGHFLGGFSGQVTNHSAASGHVTTVLTPDWLQSDPGLEFNWHPLLLTISLVYLYGNGILVYRVARNERKNRLKVAHAVGKTYRGKIMKFKAQKYFHIAVMCCATLLACLGIKAAFDSHALAAAGPIPHTYR